VLYELAQREGASDGISAAQLARALALDPGYLSRLLADFTRRGLLAKRPSLADGRQSLLSLTEAGRAAFAPLDARARQEVGAMLARLAVPAQRRLIAAMEVIEQLLGEAGPAREPYLLRPHQPGDIGWVIHRHGALYAEEYGWDERFEALVAEIASKFVTEFDSKHERCWIAERDGAIVGSVFLMRGDDEATAKLRLLYVEPHERGAGIGAALVEACIARAREVNYRRLVLWTNDILISARRLYQAKGFTLVDEQAHVSFGKALVGQTWALELNGAV
jgi:DNA-binding MarR family transcriptional regulator/N-acetylglutamate synthase-like GNAT family acetyltransferase